MVLCPRQPAHETSPARPIVLRPFTVTNSWFRGTADVRTFDPAELIATKLRALYQRKKGRDLFDLWLALTELRISPADIIESFHPYRPDGYTATAAIENFEAKTSDAAFVSDLEPLVGAWPNGYDVPAAALVPLAQVLAGWDSDAQPRWAVWLRKQQPTANMPGQLSDVLDAVITFADPALAGHVRGATWHPTSRTWRN
jgi:hypothetical protein